MTFSSDPSIQVNQLPISVEFPKEFNRFLETHSLFTKQMVNAINTKEGSIYSLQELGNFQQYYTISDPNSFRNAYRKVFDMVNLNGGNIGASATVSFPSGIVGAKYSIGMVAHCTTIDGDNRLFSIMGPTSVWMNITAPTPTINFTNPMPVALKYAIVVAEYLKN